MSTHTQGPWRVVGDFPKEVLIIPKDPSHGFRSIATINAGRREYRENAALIAAATQLQGALSLLLAEIDTRGLDVDPAYRRAAYDALAASKLESVEDPDRDRTEGV